MTITKEMEQVANQVATGWKEYGTPTRTQCKKIAMAALIEYRKVAGLEVQK